MSENRPKSILWIDANVEIEYQLFVWWHNEFRCALYPAVLKEFRDTFQRWTHLLLDQIELVFFCWLFTKLKKFIKSSRIKIYLFIYFFYLQTAFICLILASSNFAAPDLLKSSTKQSNSRFASKLGSIFFEREIEKKQSQISLNWIK